MKNQLCYSRYLLNFCIIWKYNLFDLEGISDKSALLQLFFWAKTLYFNICNCCSICSMASSCYYYFKHFVLFICNCCIMNNVIICCCHSLVLFTLLKLRNHSIVCYFCYFWNKNYSWLLAKFTNECVMPIIINGGPFLECTVS